MSSDALLSAASLEGSIDVAGRCDTGRRRSHNEDCMTLDAARGLVIVADGMGGHNAGEVASRMAVDSIHEALCDGLGDLGDNTDDEPAAHFSHQGTLLRRAIEQSNRIISQAARSQKKLEGMGTTVVSALFHDDTLSVAWVGDSRLYRYRAGRLEQMTRDHTLLQELVDRGFYSPEEARASLNRNIVTRALGVEESVAVDLIEDVVLPGDRYLLCSDGLNDMISDVDIARILGAPTAGLDTIAGELVAQANEQGGHDNITAAVIEVLRPFPVRRSWFRRVVDWFQ